MKPSFCAIANQQAGEDLIGTAGHYQTYVLIECPMPWAAKVFNSQSIPPALRQYVKTMKAERSVQFLAINRGLSASASPPSVTVMVYEKTVPSALSTDASNPPITTSTGGYRGYEFQLDDLSQVVDCVEAHWQGDRIGQPITQQDILICTHGMRDKCCARFGQPFFREAAHSLKQGNLPNTRVWKVSHIGGHRFAPTAISLPDGRYYGRLSMPALAAIVTRSGPVEKLREVYRGWGLLPAPLQVLERQLLLQHGWTWFDYDVTYRILSDSRGTGKGKSSDQIRPEPRPEQERRQRELFVEISANRSAYQTQENQTENETLLERSESVTYWAKLIQDYQNTVCVKASCSSAMATPFVKYAVAECVLVSCPQPVSVV
ncbi:MAG: sucrase ferredoxin [Cyanobacteria bacterium J06649_5]